MSIQIVQQSITTMSADIIVRPTYRAFTLLTGKVHAIADPDLPCKYVIYTIAPVWKGGKSNEMVLLRRCYIRSLKLALKLGAKSVAFPLIASGTSGFPKDRIMHPALCAISDFLNANDCDLTVYICAVDRNSYAPQISPKQKRDLDAIIAFHKTPPKQLKTSTNCCCISDAAPQMAMACAAPQDLGAWLKKQDDSFAVTLLKLIDQKGLTDVACYKKANISRKTFSKINTDKDYRPSKQTVIAFAIALELDLKETEQLLKTVGFSLSHSSTFDLIIEFCIQQKIYDVMEINEILYQYDQVCLGC